jgi:cytochrome c-type biogenesis protein
MHINGNILDISGAFFAGLLVSLTPCVLPLMPVTVAAIAGANVSGKRRMAFFLSLIYVLGLAFTYAGLAVFAAMTGKVFGAVQNTPVFLYMVAALFLFFSMIMFDIIPFPAIKLFETGKPKTPWAVFVMGLASGFVIGPCTAPALGAFLVYVASKKNILYGATLLFVFAYGVGASLILAGTLGGAVAGRFKSGFWMVGVKRLAALVLLAFAGYYLLRALAVL